MSLVVADKGQGPWSTDVGEDGYVHVVPVEDLKLHYYHQSCPCGVFADFIVRRKEAGHLALSICYVHSAWDGRE